MSWSQAHEYQYTLSSANNFLLCIWINLTMHFGGPYSKTFHIIAWHFCWNQIDYKLLNMLICRLHDYFLNVIDSLIRACQEVFSVNSNNYVSVFLIKIFRDPLLLLECGVDWPKRKYVIQK